MSLELEIQKLTDAVQELTGAIELLMERPVAEPVTKIEPKIVPQAVKPEVSPPTPVIEAAPAMPAAPTFEPAPVAAAPAVPFSDGKGLITYVMDVYKLLGAEKGAQIQSVLVNLGYQNINDVKPEDYAALYAGIEALK